MLDEAIHQSFACDAGAAQHTYTTSEDKPPRNAEPSYKPDDVTTREVVELAKLPDAQEPCDKEIPAIERADWPAPPHPAAAYPELCMSVRNSVCLSLLVVLCEVYLDAFVIFNKDYTSGFPHIPEST